MKFTVPNIDYRYSIFDTEDMQSTVPGIDYRYKVYSIEYCYKIFDTNKNNRYSRFDDNVQMYDTKYRISLQYSDNIYSTEY